MHEVDGELQREFVECSILLHKGTSEHNLLVAAQNMRRPQAVS